MNSMILTQFLIDITRGHRKTEFSVAPESVLAAAPLDDRLRAAVRNQDVATLWLAGAHPIALMYFARSCGWSNERYYGCLDEAEITRGGRAAAAP
jgi:hypothetical protein